MITAKEIKEKAQKRYPRYLSELVAGISFAPIPIPGNKKPSENLALFQKELDNLNSLSKEVKGFGYVIKWQTIHKKSIGTQDIPQEIVFDTEKDWLKFLGKEKEVEQFKKYTTLLLHDFPELKDWVIKYPLKVVAHTNSWLQLLKVLTYFRQHPKPQCYIRELPIDVHTKFIENHEEVLKELLNIILAEYLNPEEKSFEKRFHLNYEEPLIRLRMLDDDLSQKYFYGIDDLSVPINLLAKLDWDIQRVFIVENKTNLLTFPKVKNSIVFWGHGYGVSNLKNFAFLKKAQLYYWGDLDVHGFEILSQFRGYFPQTQSLLMDKSTFYKYYENEQGTPSKVTVDLNLTTEEKALYEEIKANNYRLEQEKIPQKYTEEQVEILLSENISPALV